MSFKDLSLKIGFCLLALNLGAEEKKILRVYADMVGDLFHAGHVEFFKKARAFGDYLVVGILADESVEEYKRTPILTLEERSKVISACRYVDEVILAPPLRPSKEWLKEHDIDYVVHGDDFSKELLQDQYGSSLDLGIFRSVPYTPGISSTQIIKRIVSRYNLGEFQD
jgi:cytidyltransferase-like protein